MNTFKTRYADGNIYTFSGIVLAAVNPYRRLPIYEQEIIWAYHGHSRDELAPHLFSVVEEAYQSLQRDEKSQSLIVSGESGAGKTISAKYIMRYIAELCTTGESPPLGIAARETRISLEDKILATNPILEAFGNAKTVKNDNSSRFGKYIQIYFDADTNIIGAAIRSFLLEKTRVVQQATEERNFHIFYQLLAGCPSAERLELRLRDWSQFRYLADSGIAAIDGVDEVAEFKLTREAMGIAGFTEEHQWNIFRALAGILYVGNIGFVEDSNGYAKLDEATETEVREAAHLLAVEPTALAVACLKRKISAANETVDAYNTVSQAEASRDIIAKHLYAKLFDHIIERLNDSLAPSSLELTDRFIGILDIYGFERFENNSFEQFCINYANEKLQNMFNIHVFDLEQKLYTEEGIEWSFIDFADNQLCIDLIEGKMGIFDLLNEECKFPNGTDISFVTKLLDTHGKTPQGKFLYQPKLAGPTLFTVRHFAYDVDYGAEHFLEKNRDNIAPDTLVALLSSSLLEFVRSLAVEGDSTQHAVNSSHECSPLSDSRSSVKQRSREGLGHAQHRLSTGGIFKQSLSELMNTLYSTKVHYIRCIKPNEEKRPFYFDAPFVLQQLQACGVLETIRISAAGFPGRWSFVDFIDRFSILANDPITVRRYSTKDSRDACLELLKDFKLPSNNFQIGKARVFMRTGVLAALELARTAKLNASARCIQNQLRLIAKQKLFSKLQASAYILVKRSKAFLASLFMWHLKRSKAKGKISQTFQRYCAVRHLQDSLSCLTAIVTAYRRMVSKGQLSMVREMFSSAIISAKFRSFHVHQLYHALLHIALAAQSRYRGKIAWLTLLKLREEARSVERLREVSDAKEVRIVELLNRLSIAEEHLAYEQGLNSQLRKSLEQATKNSIEAPTAVAIASDVDSTKKNLHLQERLEEAQVKLESYQQIIDSLEAANAELFQRNEDLSRQLRAFRLERLNATSTDEGKRPSTNGILRDAVTPPKTLKHLRVLSYDSTLSHLSHLPTLPQISRPATSFGGKLNELVLALNDSACLRELSQIICSYPSDGGDTTVIFGPSKIFALWITSWLGVGSNSTIVQSYLSQLLSQVKTLLLGSHHLNNDSRRRAIASEQQNSGWRPGEVDIRMSSWIANLFDFLCFLQYAVVDTMENQLDPTAVPSDQMVTLMQLRTDVARIVEELCRAWMSDLFRVLVRLGVSALLDHQGLSGLNSEQGSPKTGKDQPNESHSSLRSLMLLPFTRLASTDHHHPQVHSIEDLLAALDQLAHIMETTHLQPEIAMQIMSAILANISSSAFNQLILRKNYATWKRGIQIQYNISRLEEWATSLNEQYPRHFFSTSALASPLGAGRAELDTECKTTTASSSPLLCIEPLVQAVKLLQLAKTRAANDVDTLISACPRLSLAQIRKVLSVYVPDVYEDGPVAPDVLRNLSARLDPKNKAILTETLPEIHPHVLPLQLSIRPIPPASFSEVPSTLVPPHLWKIFSLIESCEAKDKGESSGR